MGDGSQGLTCYYTTGEIMMSHIGKWAGAGKSYRRVGAGGKANVGPWETDCACQTGRWRGIKRPCFTRIMNASMTLPPRTARVRIVALEFVVCTGGTGGLVREHWQLDGDAGVWN